MSRCYYSAAMQNRHILSLCIFCGRLYLPCHNFRMCSSTFLPFLHGTSCRQRRSTKATSFAVFAKAHRNRLSYV